MQGDKVRYVGSKLGQGSNKQVGVGEVIARVLNENGAYVVEFNDDSYVVGEASLERWVPSKKELEAALKEPEVTVHKKRRRNSDEDSK